MKLYQKIGLSIGIICCWYSCDFTNPEEFALRSADQMKGNWEYVTSTRVGAYSNLPVGYNSIGNSWLSSACDEAEEVSANESIQNFNIGNWNQYSNPDNVWSTSYQGIRKTFDFESIIEGVDWEAYRISNPTEYERRAYLTNKYKNEMLFLRAFYYFELIKRYGGVPLVTKKLDINNEWEEIQGMQRADFATCINYIVDQCDLAASKLIETNEVADAGSPTKGSALALKSRVLLYAASDLYNQDNNDNPLIGYVDDNRLQRWIQAAEAAWKVLQMVPDTYQLNNSYEALFRLGSAQNKEVIFERRKGQLNVFESANYPITFNGGKTGTCPSQNLVDAYEMKGDGSAFDWNKPEHSASPYTNRDPRLAMSIVTNNSTFNGRTIELWEGGRDGIPIEKSSKTGYYLKKYVVQGLDLTKGDKSYHQWIFLRLAEIYLNYAEAMNEAYGPDYTNTNLTMSAREAVNTVRDRTGVKMPAFPADMTKEAFRSKLRNERRVELAFEDHRYWDVRRWCLGESGIGGELRGVKITNLGGAFGYKPFVVEDRIYEPKMSFYPIPASEIVKSGGNIKQNPSW